MSFSVAASVGVASNTDESFDTIVYDFGANFDTTNHWFNCPTAGLYHFDAAVTGAAALADGSTFYVVLFLNGAEVKRGLLQSIGAAVVAPSGSVSCTLLLAVGDHVTVRHVASVASTSGAGGTQTYFMGYPVPL